jgi:hypothetical protein
MTVAWSEKDQHQLRARGISIEAADQQLRMLRQPSDHPHLIRPCRIDDGIQQIPEGDHGRLLEMHQHAAQQGRWRKFVPASGAASRMFAWKDQQDLRRLAEHLDRFAFYAELESAASRNGYTLSELRAAHDDAALEALLLADSGLGLSKLPKALLPFHAYGSTNRTSFEEHLREAAACFADHQQRCCAHFTVSPEHQHRFENSLVSLVQELRSEIDVRLDVGFSQQQPSTDLLALDQHDEPLRDDDGILVFRPGGHGALLDNLHDLGADLVFVKNVDNIAHANRRAAADHWIKVLGGYLIHLQDEVHRCLASLHTMQSAQAWQDADPLLQNALTGLIDGEADSTDPAQQRQWLQQRLDRPLRICGVVPNEGEPGGGPFWVRQADQSLSLQIIESAEVAPQDPAQQEIFTAATHFNPVFMALGLRDAGHRPYPLQDYVDNQRFFLTAKTAAGRPIRVLERPGLWNGSMAYWNTVFVEVPKTVFSPVKTVFDLLRPEHQP